MKFINESIYWHGTGRSLNVLTDLYMRFWVEHQP